MLSLHGVLHRDYHIVRSPSEMDSQSTVLTDQLLLRSLGLDKNHSGAEAELQHRITRQTICISPH